MAVPSAARSLENCEVVLVEEVLALLDEVPAEVGVAA
jgi:hypothetical protein